MSAILSECGRYRYRLEREGPGEGTTVVIMVNPSTADAEIDDATIRKLKGFGARNRWGRLVVGNLFAYRATDVRELARVADPIGPDNDIHLLDMFFEADRVIFAWGRNNKVPAPLSVRWRSIWALTHLQPMCFGVCADGHPKHPLTLDYRTPLVEWSPPRAS